MYGGTWSKRPHVELNTMGVGLDDFVYLYGDADERRDVDSHVYSSSSIMTTWSQGMPHNTDASSLISSSQNSSSTNTGFVTVTPNSITMTANIVGSSLRHSNSVTSSMLSNSLLTFGGCHSPEHHAVANTSGSSGVNMLCQQNDVSELIAPQLLQMTHGNYTGCMLSSDANMITAEKWIGCQNRDVVHTIGYDGNSIMSQMPSSHSNLEEILHGRLVSTSNTMQGMHEATKLEICMDHDLTGNMTMRPDSILSASGNLNSPASCFSVTKNDKDIHAYDPLSSMSAKSVGGYHQIDLQSAECASPIFQSPVEWDSQVNNSAEHHPLQSRREFQQSWHCQGLLYKLSCQHTCKQKEWYLSQEQPLADKKLLGFSLAENNLDASQMKVSLPQQMQLESQATQDVVKQALPSLKGFIRNTFPASGKVAIAFGSKSIRGDLNMSRSIKILVVYQHAIDCFVQETECQFPACKSMKRILHHMSHCDGIQCGRYCLRFHRLFHHYQTCSDRACCICHLVRVRVHQLHCNSSLQNFDNVAERTHGAGVTVSKAASPTCNTEVEVQNHPKKRMKKEHPSVSNIQQIETTQISKPTIDHTYFSSQGELVRCQQMKTGVTPRTVIMETEVGQCVLFSQKSGSRSTKGIELTINMEPDVQPMIQDETNAQCQKQNILVQIMADKVELGMNCKDGMSQAAYTSETKLELPVIKCASLIETFTPQQVREHIRSLRQCVNQKKTKANVKNMMDDCISEITCDLCGMAQLSFEPPPRYCAECKQPIECGAVYYFKISSNTMENGVDVCIKCHKEGSNRQEKRKNDGAHEPWVQCDKCDAWQHQICALFNGKRNWGGQAEYTCPNCFLQEIESGKHKPLPLSTLPEAKELPSTCLSDHIEKWLFRRLNQERDERANTLGKKFDEVPGAEGLVIRVVSSVNKKLEVEKLFHEIFKEDNYPYEFPYKSKAILLFQKIEGVDVCLFAMYVQEFGSECAYPNQRRVCLSYVDSVKYFRPDIKTVTGEALHTFVYHQILIGYLDYCKKRGFTSFHIWVCPPVKGDDYILYCHPKIQKTPKATKLREWYLAVIRKAVEEKIVVDYNNLYDEFFIPTGECKVQLSAARLPYFDGDYWPRRANEFLKHEDGRILENQIKNAVVERAFRAARRDNLTRNLKDILLMQQLGDCIRSIKEDFMMIHLQHVCSHCCRYILSGFRWVCNVCKKFQLCEKCRDIEQSLTKKDRHPIGDKEKHSFRKVQVNKVSADTDDKDEAFQCDFFDTRVDFLRLCQRNHYQFDTLRRAKHSTMMALYHLHNPTVPAFISSCLICHNDIELTLGWHCMTCPNYDVCDSCYEREGGSCHDHELVKLVSGTTIVNHDMLQNQGTQKKLAPKEPSLSDILVHASMCFARGCNYQFCRRIRGLFHHTRVCQIHACGGCKLCKKIWYILKLHAEACKVAECNVPKCRDLKHHLAEKSLKFESYQRGGVKQRK